MTDPKPPPQWRVEATKIRGGFALRLIGEGDLGKVLNDDAAIVVEMGRGRTLPLYEALLELINSRVLGFIVLMEQEQVDAGRRVGQHQAARSRSGLQ